MTSHQQSHPLNAVPGSSRETAARIGTTIKTNIERGDRYSAPEVYNLELTILESLRGGSAISCLRENGITGYSGQIGFEPVLAQVQIGYFIKGRGFGKGKKPYTVEPCFFYVAFEGGQNEYGISDLNQHLAEAIIGRSLTPGETQTGWIALEIPVEERNPLLVFKRDYLENTYGEWPPIWFRLEKID